MLLDTTTLTTKEQILNFDFSPYMGKSDPNWVKHIKYPVSQNELDRLWQLSDGYLGNSMGDLYISKTKRAALVYKVKTK